MSGDIVSLKLNPEKATIFISIIDTIHHFSNDTINIIINTKGLHIMLLDPSLSAYVKLFLDPGFFIEYEQKQPEINFSISIESLAKILKCHNKEDYLYIKLPESKTNVHFIIENGKKRQTIKLPLLDIDIEDLPIPEMKYEYVYQIKSKMFQRMIKDLSIMNSSEITLKASKDKFIFESNGDIANSEYILDCISRINYLKTKILIEKNNRLIKVKTKLIKEHTKLIKENTKLIKENTKLIKENTKHVQDNTSINLKDDTIQKKAEIIQINAEIIQITKTNSKLIIEMETYNCIVFDSIPSENNATFSFKLLTSINRACSYSRIGPIISFKKSYPLKLQLNFDKISNLIIYIAPKLE